jgi:hypothetical protein
MKRRAFLALMIPAVSTACVGMGEAVLAPQPTNGVQPEQSEAAGKRSFDMSGGDNLRSFMKRARDRRDAAKKRRERRARARRRRRNRGL